MVTCGKCGKEGHNRVSCGRKSKTHRVKASGLPHAAIGMKRKCKKCGQMGHMAKTCNGVTGGCVSWAYAKAKIERELDAAVAAEDYTLAAALKSDLESTAAGEVIIYDPRKRHWEK